MKFDANAGKAIISGLNAEQLRNAMRQAKEYVDTKAFKAPKPINPDDDFWRIYRAVLIDTAADEAEEINKFAVWDLYSWVAEELIDRLSMANKVYVVFDYSNYTNDIHAIVESEDDAKRLINGIMTRKIAAGQTPEERDYGWSEWTIWSDSNGLKVDLQSTSPIEYKTAYSASKYADGRYKVDRHEGVAALRGETHRVRDGVYVSFVSEEHAMGLLLQGLAAVPNG
jgi:hypothetical protein